MAAQEGAVCVWGYQLSSTCPLLILIYVYSYGQAMTVEKTKIWGNPLIKELLQVVLFGQAAKADARSVQEVRKTKSIPISAVILSIVAVCFLSPLPYAFTHYSIDRARYRGISRWLLSSVPFQGAGCKKTVCNCLVNRTLLTMA